jgi:hypothetical protein
MLHFVFLFERASHLLFIAKERRLLGKRRRKESRMKRKKAFTTEVFPFVLLSVSSLEVLGRPKVRKALFLLCC